MSKHTPGPWEWRDRSGAGLEIMAPVLRVAEANGAANPSAPAMSPIFDMQSGEGLQYIMAYEIWTRFSPAWWGEMQKANACLISAAPDLLEMLRVVKKYFDTEEPHPILQADINEVIRKATGEQP